MTPSSPSSWSSTVASLRKASDGRLAGGREAAAHFERYVNLLFRLTVAHKDSAIRLSRLAASSTAWVLTGGHDPRGDGVIRLTDGRCLRLVAVLELDASSGDQLRVQAMTWQYQNANDDDSWVFRADYSRAQIAATSPPRGHLHVDGTLRQPDVLGPKQPLGRVHFPCGQPTLEAAVVLLADESGVPTNAPPEVWRAAVAEHEAQSARLFGSCDVRAERQRCDCAARAAFRPAVRPARSAGRPSGKGLQLAQRLLQSLDLVRIPPKANTLSAPSRTPVPVMPNTIGAKR